MVTAQWPQAYAVLKQQGWSWASLRGSLGHLVPPEGDMAYCGRLVPRGARQPMQHDELTRSSTCAQCRHRAQLS